jgi:hypothetical protein
VFSHCFFLFLRNITIQNFVVVIFVTLKIFELPIGFYLRCPLHKRQQKVSSFLDISSQLLLDAFTVTPSANMQNICATFSEKIRLNINLMIWKWIMKTFEFDIWSGPDFITATAILIIFCILAKKMSDIKFGNKMAKAVVLSDGMCADGPINVGSVR